MNTVLLILIVGLGVILFFNAFVSIDENTVAVPTIFGKRTSKVLTEGLNTIIPFIEDVKEHMIFSTKLQTMDVNMSFLTSNEDMFDSSSDDSEDEEDPIPQLEIILKGTMRWKVNPLIKDEVDRLQFSNIAPDDPSKGPESRTLKEGLRGKIDSELGRFGGIELYYVFIKDRRAIEHYINSILKLEAPPHVNPNKYLLDKVTKINNSEEEDVCDLDKLEQELLDFCDGSIEKEISREKRINFYDKFSNYIGIILREKETTDPEKGDHSTVEQMYGIDLVEFTIDDVDFTEKTKQALEKEAQAMSEIEGKEKYSNEAIKMARKLVDQSEKDISWKQAIKHAEAVLEIAEKKNYDFEGIPENLNLFGSSGGNQ